MLESLDRLPDAWGLIGSNQRARLRDLILNRNWVGVDHFPGLTVGQLRTSVGAANYAAGKYPSLSGAPLAAPYVELGPLAASALSEADWQAGPESSAESAAALEKDLGFDLTMGDPPHPELWKWHRQSQHAAYLFNRLALNRTSSSSKHFQVRVKDQTADSPEALVALLARSGYEVSIEDARYFANFGHLHFKGQDVLMPFWLDTRIPIPGIRQTLLVPVTHAEEEIRIRNKRADLNADIAFYFGIDGMAEFRTMDTLDQYWVGKNVAHVWRQESAVDVARLLAEALTTYGALHQRYPGVPFHGYYRFGVCQDVVAAIEYRMTHEVTLFPITHDPAYFKGSTEMDRLFGKIPNDRNNGRIEWARIRGSLPAHNLTDIRIPDLRQNLEIVDKSQSEKKKAFSWTAVLGAVALLLLVGAALLRRRRDRALVDNASR